MRKVAIIGLGPGSENAPRNWERWGLIDGKDYSLDRYFEIHEDWRDTYRTHGVPTDIYSDIGAPVMMINKDASIETCERYPVEAAINEVGEYFEGTMAYALAYAIVERVPTIGLYGISGDDVYESRPDSTPHLSAQRPNLEYLIGYARGLGISVHIGQPSALTTSRFKDGRYGIGTSELKD